MRTGLPRSGVAPRRANITTPRCQSRAAAPRPRERSRHPHITALIVAERRHSAITRYAERSAVCRDSARPCCRRAGGTPLLQSRSPTARAVTLSVNPRQRRGHTHRRMRRGRAAADALQHCIYSGTALRCISPFPLYPRTRCPGLTENGSALRTSPSTLSDAPLP